MTAPNSPAERRKQLLHAGFSPIPLQGKLPVLKEWQKKIETNDGEIALWEKVYPHASNTGFLTQRTPTLDIDITDEPAARAVEDLIREKFEERGYVLVRFGRRPKRAIPFRTNDPFRKIICSLISSDGKREKIELLGDGQQLACFGLHPDTNQPYEWFGGLPGEIAHDDLPYISVEEARECVEASGKLLIADYGYKPVDGQRPEAGPTLTGDGKPANWDQLITNIIVGVELHDSMVQLSASFAAKGFPPGDVTRLLKSLLASSDLPHDHRWQERFDDIDRIVSSAHDKFAKAPETEPAEPAALPLRAYVPRAFSEIPRRQWLHAGHYIRRHVVMTVGPGGYGKTSLILCNVVEMTLGTGLIGPAPTAGALRVGYWNGEDPDDEIERRIAAICIRHNVDHAKLEGKLFLGSKITGRRIAALDRSGNVVCDQNMLAAIRKFVAEQKIDCLIFDPLIAFHSVPESNNTAMEQVVKDAFESIADQHNCCVELSQHTRKNSQAGNQGELTVDDSRGGSAVTNAARSVRIINRMTPGEAVLPKIVDEDRRHYLRVSRDKTNLTPPGKATWVRLVSVELPNAGDGHAGDNVQAVDRWDYPQPFDDVTANDMRWMRTTVRAGEYRADPRSPDWAGVPLAKRLDLDPTDKGDRARISAILKTWLGNGVLAIERRKDDTRHEREYVIPGNWTEAADDDASVDLF